LTRFFNIWSQKLNQNHINTYPENFDNLSTACKNERVFTWMVITTIFISDAEPVVTKKNKK